MKPWKVRDIMTADVAVIPEDAPYRRIVEVLAERRVTAVPVVDTERHVLGVVSEADLLHKVEFVGGSQERHLFEGRRERAARNKATGDTARDLMTAPPVTIRPDASVAEAARTMAIERVKRLPVVDEANRLVGVVSRGDLVRIYLRSDDEIREAVTREVLTEVLWIEPGRIDVAAHGGVVTLTGKVDRRTTALIAVRLAAGMPGVVRVVDEIEFDYDDSELAASRFYRSHPFGDSRLP
ncbi:MAG TPA: CBS domain-containing protein [Micromonosporaceae bacterium]